MNSQRTGDTFDISSLDALSISSTPRMLQQDKESKAANAADNNDGGVAANPDNTFSDYSVHLSALGLPSAASPLNLDREAVKLDSEDIGGPSDFTLNLDQYINGSGPAQAKTVAAAVISGASCGAAAAADLYTDHQSRKYTPPNVEDRDTPLPVEKEPVTPIATTAKSATSNAKFVVPVTPIAKPVKTVAVKGQDLASPQCLPTTPPPSTNGLLHAKIDDLGTRCDILQRKNEWFRNALEQAAQNHHIELADSRRIIEVLSNENMGLGTALSATERDLQLERNRADHTEATIDQERTANAIMQARSNRNIVTYKGFIMDAQKKLDAQSAIWDAESAVVKQLKLKLKAQDQKHKEEMSALRQEYEGVAKEVDDWIVSEIAEKDRQTDAVIGNYQAEVAALVERNKELEKLVETSGRELMLAWGRGELGPARDGQRQRYRYLHA